MKKNAKKLLWLILMLLGYFINALAWIDFLPFSFLFMILGVCLIFTGFIILIVKITEG